MTKLVIETALEEEMSEHLGYDKHAMEGRNRGNSGNVKRSKTILTDAAGAVEIEVRRDREATFAPVIAGLAPAPAAGQRTVVLNLSSRGLTSGEISAHVAEVCGASVPGESITRITDSVLREMAAWWTGPLERVYAAILVDGINVKVRDGQVGPNPFHAHESGPASMAARTSWR